MNRISDRTLDKIIEEAFELGMRYGEMRVMGNKDMYEFREKAMLTLRSNAKSLLLQDARDYEDRNKFL